MDSFEFPSWIAELIRDLLNDPCAKIAFLVVHDQVSSPVPQLSRGLAIFRKIRNLLTGNINFKKIFWGRYFRWDSERVKPMDDPFTSINLTEELKAVPRIQVIPQTDRFFHRFEETDLEKIRAEDLDVVLRFGFNIIKGPILESARFGVWSFHHGDNQYYRGGPPYFWELYNEAPLSGIILQILNEKLDSGRVLYRSYGRTMQGMSVKWNSLSSYWKGSSFVLRRLQQLHEFGFEWMQKELPALREDPKIQGKLFRIPTNGQLLRFIFRGFVRNLKARLKMRGKIEQWYVSYRDRNGGEAITLPSPKGHYYADPFPIRRGGKDYIFFEDYIYQEGRGVISYVEVRPDLSTSEARVVLDLPYHLSYPFLFEHEGELHMIPETGANRTVELYKAVEFPERWELVKVLNQGLQAYDVTLLVRDGVYWFFASVVERGDASSDELFLYSAESLTGEWIPHPKNPVVSDVRRARPAGYIFERDGKLIRPSQDGTLGYGCAYNLNEIVVLTKTDYEERPIAHVEPDRSKGQVGMHTYNFNERLEVIDIRAILPVSEVLG